jgi:hypothetical protein
MTRAILGTQLAAEDQKTVLAAYVHRYTREHVPRWARQPQPDGTPYPVHFASDAEWLAHTRFHVRADGRLDERFRMCMSSPTWPDNPELQRRAGAE